MDLRECAVSLNNVLTAFQSATLICSVIIVMANAYRPNYL